MKNSHLPGAILFCALAVQATSSLATVITRDFNVDFTTGALAGQNFMGTLSYDDTNLTGVGFEVLAPTGASSNPEGVLSFDVTIDGIAFQMSDDIDFPEAPGFFFADGVLTNIDYIGTPNPGNPPELNLTIPFVEYIQDFDTSTGTVTLKPLNGVPEPAALALFGLGLLGVGVARRRKSAV